MSWTRTRNMFGLLQQTGKHLNKTGFSDFNALVVYCIRFVYPLYASLGSAPQLLLLRAACQSGLSEEQPAESFRGSFTQCRSMDGRSYLPSWFIMAYICFWKSQAHKMSEFWDASSQVLLTFCGTKTLRKLQVNLSLQDFSLSDYPMTQPVICHSSFDHLRPTIFALLKDFLFISTSWFCCGHHGLQLQHVKIPSRFLSWASFHNHL